MTIVHRNSTLDRAHRALQRAVDLLDPESLRLPTPCDRWTVAQVLEHAVLDQRIWAGVVGDGAPPDGDAFAPSGDLPADVSAMTRTALTHAAQVWHRLSPDTHRVSSPLPQGELDVDTARNAAALDAAIHAWDIAAALGAQPNLDDELAAALLPVATLIVEPLRQWGAYAAALPRAGTDSAAETLLRFLGRDPHWRATR